MFAEQSMTFIAQMLNIIYFNVLILYVIFNKADGEIAKVQFIIEPHWKSVR